MSDDARGTRRSFLALVGTAATTALAGCNRLGLGSDDDPTLDGEALERAVSTEGPTIPQTIPVDVERSYLDETAASARETLASVPAPFEASEIPNGAIRSELDREYDRAVDLLDERARTGSAYEELLRLRGARAAAGAVADGWRTVDEGRGIDAVRERARGVHDDLQTFRRRWRYVGDDPIRAVVVHAAVEGHVAYAGRLANGVARGAEGSRRRTESALGVADAASDAAGARAALTDGAYLYDRFDASLADPRRLGRGLRAANESLVATLDERRESLPTVDEPSSYVGSDVEHTPVEYALRSLRDVSYADGLEDERATGQRANVVLSVHETLAQIRAFERLRTRVETGEYEPVRDVAGVRRRRRAAVEALESAIASETAPRLDRRVLNQLARTFRHASEEIHRTAGGETVRLDSLERELGQLLSVEAMARATPEASGVVADVLRRRL